MNDQPSNSPSNPRPRTSEVESFTTSESSDTKRILLGLMAKYWTPGAVKTRLGQLIGMEQSACLQKLFLTHLADSLSDFATRRVVAVTPIDKLQEVAKCVSPAWDVVPQADGDLGHRMQSWFRDALTDSDYAILIGADCPLLDPQRLGSASDFLQQHDVVVGPAVDGGYYLIGLRGPWDDRYDSLFDDIPWSTDQVLARTLSRASANDLSLVQLAVDEDIDTRDSLQRLRRLLNATADTSDRHRQLAAGIDEIWT
ncbi:MAG: glycosyltransferase, partial [Pirellulaceae bacterium]|nr:glycosyltransferase [Pirellulaceae bacterium]